MMSTHDKVTDDTTDFGFERVKTGEKAGRVRGVGARWGRRQTDLGMSRIVAPRYARHCRHRHGT